MKVFNGKQAANDYMSTHTLAFSTPELTLMRFSFWLGDMVRDPTAKEQSIPRLYTYVEEKDFAPVEIIDDDVYVPSGAVLRSGMYGSANSASSGEEQFCSDCGVKNSPYAKFCRECGVNIT
ncbi:MAG: zinc ribbon domain-containing protein [Crenarchaeota archaeon]|nr:zinc ribbon domain-containing protein [Thermoproteota archaeon]MDA1124565.1 zinc ribbon domain-containing protein [Thermoproteota archaeon]